PQDVLDASYDAGMELYSELASDPEWKKIYDSMMAFQVDNFLWSQVAEGTYADFMREKQRAGELPGQQTGGGEN
ncbi:MAG: hypothetical protein WA906_07865, partial [Pacificimonas sp.]